MIFSLWPYVKTTPNTGELHADVRAFLRANGKEVTLAHCEAVASLAEALAARFGADEDALKASGLLHDVSCVVRPDDMRAFALNGGRFLDASEEAHPFLLHGFVSAALAEEYFSVGNRAVLSAIDCHSTLKADPSDCELILFLADKLAWDQPGEPPFYGEVTAALDTSLHLAARIYIEYALAHGMILRPHRRLVQALDWLRERT